MKRIGNKAFFILFTLTDPFPTLPDPTRPWLVKRLLGDTQTMGLYDLNKAFRRIAKDTRVEGVVLHLRNSGLGAADLQTLRDGIKMLRKGGKRVIVYSQGYNLQNYYVACAADEILIQPAGIVNVCGIRANYIFLKEALESVGIEFDLLSSQPYKIAGDMLTKSSPTPEFDEEVNKIVDSWFDILVKDISSDRNIKPEEVRAMIDGALYADDEAVKAGYIDGIVNEERLSSHLRAQDILSWEEAKRVVRRESWLPQIFYHRYVALVRIEGMIVEGQSSNFRVPLLGPHKLAGDLTIIQQIRQVMNDKNAAALLVYIDSPGGSATSSEAIASALREFSKERPVIVYMNNVAASGGYWISTAANWIVAQPATLTGSVGAVIGKMANEKLYQKLGIRRVEYARGENSTSFGRGGPPYTDAERNRVRSVLDHLYKEFAALVGESRNMTQDELDAACQGRCWRATQALKNKMVDEIGGLDAALRKARELAGLPDSAPLVMPSFKKKATMPPRVVTPAPESALGHLNSVVSTLGSGVPLLLMPFWVQ